MYQYNNYVLKLQYIYIIRLVRGGGGWSSINNKTKVNNNNLRKQKLSDWKNVGPVSNPIHTTEDGSTLDYIICNADNNIKYNIILMLYIS